MIRANKRAMTRCLMTVTRNLNRTETASDKAIDGNPYGVCVDSWVKFLDFARWTQSWRDSGSPSFYPSTSHDQHHCLDSSDGG